MAVHRARCTGAPQVAARRRAPYTRRMNLPTPNADEVAGFVDLYRRETGKQIAHDDARDAFTRIVQFIYLTEYYPKRPLIAHGPSAHARPPEHALQPQRSDSVETQAAATDAGTGTPDVGSDG